MTIPAAWEPFLAGVHIPVVPEPAYPPEHLRFRALSAGYPDQIRVVMLGQDPYHCAGQATGLAFSVPAGSKIPPSLRNIFSEIESEPDLANEERQDDFFNGADLLSGWHQQGVMLLNTALSVAPGEAGSHAKIGWEPVTNKIVSAISEQSPACVFILWGAHAQARKPLINTAKHFIIESAHPSPLSAHRGFFGSRPFSRANDWLRSKGLPAVRWKQYQANQ